MPPLRRYLRITQHSVLEVRIYVSSPPDIHRWLLAPGSTALTRIIAAVQPLILPKLREENAARSKGGKKVKGWKDTVAGEDFEVGVFLTEGGCRHGVLRRERRVKGERGVGVVRRTVGGKMTGGGREEPVIVAEEDEEESEAGFEGPGTLADIPLAVDDEGSEALFVGDEEDDGRSGGMGNGNEGGGMGAEVDDKKKLGFATTYEGFSIYGRILCLVVKRKGGTVKEREQSRGDGQAMMEEWISSTQMGDDTMV